MLVKDTITALIFYNAIANSYHLENKMNSAMIVAQQTYNKFLSINRKDLAAGTCGVMTDVCIKRKDYKKAKQLIDDYELYSGLFKNGKVVIGHEMHYALKGDYFKGVNMPDSALCCYYRLLHYPSSLDNNTAAYQGLMSTYAMIGRSDSVSKYAALYEIYNDSLTIRRSSLEINKMRAIYDYSESQKQAFEKAEEVNRYKYICLLTLLFASVTVSVVYYKYRQRMRKRTEQMASINAKYSETLYKYKTLMEDYASLKKDSNAFTKQKEQEIEKYSIKLVALMDDETQLDAMNAEHDLISSDVVKRFHTYAAKGESPAACEWKLLDELVKCSIPKLCEIISEHRNQLSNTDVRVCHLIRLQFITTEVASLLDTTKQRVSNIKNRLNTVLFNTSGAKTFGSNIQNL